MGKSFKKFLSSYIDYVDYYWRIKWGGGCYYQELYNIPLLHEHTRITELMHSIYLLFYVPL
jgi:hypothetical protein